MANLTGPRELLDQENYDQALELLDKAREAGADWLCLRGRALSGLHRWPEAMEAFRAALAEDPDCHEAIAGVALLQFLTGDLPLAQKNIDVAVELAPEKGRYHGLRGMIAGQVGQLGVALESLNRAYELGDRDSSHILARAQLLIAGGRVEEAEAALGQAEENGAEAVSLLNLKASLALGTGRHTQALDYYKEAATQEPDRVDNWWNLLGLMASVDRNKLKDHLKQARLHHPLDERLLVLEAAHHRENGELKQALALLQDACQRQPASLVLLEVLGDYLRDDNQLEASLECFEKALQREPDSARAHFGKGLAVTSREQSLQSFQRAVELEPDNVVYRYHVGAVLSALDRYEEALSHLSRVVELDPTFWRAYHERSICFENMGRFQKAERERQLADKARAKGSKRRTS